MPRYVALLRGVNLAGHNRIAMAALRRIGEDLGHADVRTHIASGNLLFASPERSAAKVRAGLEAAVEAHMGKPILVLVRSAAQLAATAALPVPPGLDPASTRLWVTFLERPPKKPLPEPPPGLEVLGVAGADALVLLRLDEGRWRDPNPFLEAAGGGRGTTRNLNVVRALEEKAKGGPS